jgi:rhodanese-related sulfurtransferase
MDDAFTITPEALWARLGRFDAPVVLDVRIEADVAADPVLIPSARRLPGLEAAAWAGRFAGREVVAACAQGHAVSQGAVAWLRAAGARAVALEGGLAGWRAAGLPVLPDAALPPRDGAGRTIWVTRTRPKVDRIACPWLIRRFVDPEAVILFVEPAEVAGVARRLGAEPFDIEGVRWSHDGPRCTFDVMVEAFGLGTEPMLRLAAIVRGADTADMAAAPQAAGLLAASLGFSRLHADDHAQLDAAMALYDALWLWARDAHGETHNWPAPAAAPAPEIAR